MTRMNANDLLKGISTAALEERIESLLQPSELAEAVREYIRMCRNGRAAYASSMELMEEQVRSLRAGTVAQEKKPNQPVKFELFPGQNLTPKPKP